MPPSVITAPLPAALDDPERAADLARMKRLATSLFLLATNAISLREWIDEQTPGPRQAQLAALAERWDAFTLSIGLGLPRAVLHREWKAAEAARFGHQPADQR